MSPIFLLPAFFSGLVCGLLAHWRRYQRRVIELAVDLGRARRGEDAAKREAEDARAALAKAVADSDPPEDEEVVR